jgi:ABC-type glycerol-3-phosphate transport system substrate-binding protein
MTDTTEKKESQSVSRRKFVELAGVGAVGLAVGAAAGYYAGQTGAGVTAPTTSAATTGMTPIELYYLNFDWVSEGIKPWMQTIENKFLNAHPGVTIRNEGMPSMNVREKLLKMIAAASAPDAVALQDSDTKDFIDMEALLPLDNYLTSDLKSKLLDGAYEHFHVGEHYYGIPWGGPTDDCLQYNVKMYADAGVSKPPETGPTFDEFVEACVATTRDLNKDGTIEQWGLVREYRRPRYAWDDFFVANDGVYFNEDGTCALNAEPGIKTLEEEVMLYAEKKVIYQDLIDSWMARKLFATQVAANFVDGSWNLGIWATENPEFKPVENFDYVFQPKLASNKYRGFLSFWPQTITVQSKHPDLAWDLISSFVFDDENARTAVSQAGFETPRKDWKEIGIQYQGLMKVFADQAALLRSVYPPKPGRWPKPDYVAEQLRLAINNALFKKKTPKQALDDCAAAIEAQLGKDWAKPA